MTTTSLIARTANSDGARALLALLLIASILLPSPGEARRRRRAMPSTGPAAEAFADGTRRFKARDYLGAIEAYEKLKREYTDDSLPKTLDEALIEHQLKNIR